MGDGASPEAAVSTDAARHVHLHAADSRVLRPKSHVDWPAQRLVCPHAAAHGTFHDIDAFCRHVVYECDAPTAGATGSVGHPLPTSAAPPAAQRPSRARPLELTAYHGVVADPEALADRRYSATVTVSPGNCWFTAENTCRLVDFALEATEGPVLVMIPDIINSLNEAVKGTAIAKAARQQERLAYEFKGQMEALLVGRLDAPSLARLRFVGFRDWMRLHAVQAAADRDAVLQLYATDDDFARAVDDYCEPWCHKPWRPTTHVHRACAVQYFLEELASLCVPAASGALEMEVYAQSDHFKGCAPREMALAKLFPGRTQRIHAMFSDASLGTYGTG